MFQSNQVLSFLRPTERGDWSQPELAEFYRVEDALAKSGVGISTDRGVTDEGDPWFVFFRQDNEEVIVHFARIGGEYVVASNFTEAVFRGRNFQTLVRELLDSHPYVLPKQHSSRSTVFLHPATLLAALVVTGYFKSSELNATADDGGQSERPFGWFLNRHDLAATYSAIIFATVWDGLATGGSVSKPSDDLASLDHAQSAHSEHGPDIGLAFADDSLLQNFQAFHGTDDQSVLATAAVDLDGQDVVHHFNEPAIAGLVANPFGLHSEPGHYQNAATSFAHDVFRAVDLASKLDFHLLQDDGFSIAAREQGERSVAHNPVSSSVSSNLTPDHPAPQPVSTAPATAIAHVDTTVASDNHASALHVDDSIHSSVANVPSPSEAIQALFLTPQPEVTSSVDPTAQANQLIASVDPAAAVNPVAASIDPAAAVNPVAASIDPAAAVNPVAASIDPAAAVNPVAASIDPAAAVNPVAPSADPAPAVNPVATSSDPAAAVNPVAASSDPAAAVNAAAASADPAAAVNPAAASSHPAAAVNPVAASSDPAAAVNAAAASADPAAQGTYAANTHDHNMSDIPTVGILGIDVHPTA